MFLLSPLVHFEMMCNSITTIIATITTIAIITNDKSVNQLFSRPFLTVPYMGNGSGNPCVDSMLKPGEDTFQGKACNNKRENPNFQPLVKCLKNNVQNTKHLIPEDVKIDWVRGGIPSRQLVRDIEYKERCQE